ncbi:MAG: ATP-dependent Clp protease adaptor ClpS [Bacteroidetes bacterium]|jgi:ATP-dependent Clp protease adaptor protein ClpS|nr:ATP-dependent Clp protease adaptor ClpS [Bacteroidota bacterium]MDA0985273.1 ATP-dependent Clp protease adaptor ClpS [Bacteroidota bacterium]HAS20021.1 Clp protease ClpS [Flavobacteriaceae bacterium]
MVRTKVCKISSTNPSENPQIEEEVSVLADKEHEIILYNDDVNTFDHVIACLVKICEHSLMQAEQCAYLVHFTGKCAVKSGSIEFLTPRCAALLEEGLSAEIV